MPLLDSVFGGEWLLEQPENTQEKINTGSVLSNVAVKKINTFFVSTFCTSRKVWIVMIVAWKERHPHEKSCAFPFASKRNSSRAQRAPPEKPPCAVHFPNNNSSAQGRGVLVSCCCFHIPIRVCLLPSWSLRMKNVCVRVCVYM